MQLIAGLGNPGKRYRYTRHNAGFMTVDELARRWSLRFKRTLFLNAYLAQAQRGGERVLLLKPAGYMNTSGVALLKASRKYDIPPEKIILIYDDVDLAPGKIRFRTDGSSAGHKGVDSVLTRLKTQSVSRIRIGIGRPPNADDDIAEYVLSAFTNEESRWLPDVIREAADCCEEWLYADRCMLMQKYNG